MRKKLNIFTHQLPILHIRIGNLDWCKCGHRKNETREMDCSCCREVHVVASAKMPECERSILPSSCYSQLL